MKQLMMGFAACALIMTSCAKQEISESATDNQGLLSFSTGIGKQSTKAAELNNTSLQNAAKTNGIVIHAYQNPEGTWSKWFDDQVVYNPTWALKNSTRFRNQNDTKYITYFSTVPGALTVTPADFTNADFTSNFPKFGYTVAANAATQEDLIAGITEIAANKTDITLGMRHILSQVNFGTVGYKGANIAIRNIKIVGLYDNATYTFGSADSYPIGGWDVSGAARTASYDYYAYTNATAINNPQPVVSASVEKGDIYIFGDGGNWGPGKSVFYPVGAVAGAWEKFNTTAPQTGLKNSLMLMPQSFTGVPEAKVTFEYQITDVNGAYVAGGPAATDWASGEFKLDFSTGATQGEHYMAKWDQNFRYVYLIDFTDFLDGNALTFTVDVELYPWENYNNGGDDNGEVEIRVAGQPSAANMNVVENDDTWYIATQSTTQPTTLDPLKWAQVVRDEMWNLSNYDFRMIEKDGKFVMSFQNVIFNTKGTNPVPTEITLTLPTGYTLSHGTGITVDDSNAPVYVLSAGNRTADATVTITNGNEEYSTSATLNAAITAVIADNQVLTYKGMEPVNLKTMEPDIATTGETLKVGFSSSVVPTVGKTMNGEWIWTVKNKVKVATWTRK